jgi:hypothetical protein
MPIVHECAESACHILTMGTHCIEHERSQSGSSFLDRLDVSRAQVASPECEGGERTQLHALSG